MPVLLLHFQHRNAVRGSAVCAFAYSDIENTFKGRFKGQESYLHNWLPISWDDTPKPQPVMVSSLLVLLPDHPSDPLSE